MSWWRSIFRHLSFLVGWLLASEPPGLLVGNRVMSSTLCFWLLNLLTGTQILGLPTCGNPGLIGIIFCTSSSDHGLVTRRFSVRLLLLTDLWPDVFLYVFFWSRTCDPTCFCTFSSDHGLVTRRVLSRCFSPGHLCPGWWILVTPCFFMELVFPKRFFPGGLLSFPIFFLTLGVDRFSRFSSWPWGSIGFSGTP